eukprot:gnl/TRDRNA2_/TRDRNA2_177733_c0_seq2.p1 gnl/TRDRNA2_/TRDRNA2_177733_c0~~gnl/TRDRNA2_/TRDRNA2_177733_c0_seq2.p1  ORF type:complete len:734 (+),score=239.71 gnl/TRDRNA2_/TRDRNA2_177733_c0_seq2:60-2261(+)
MSLATNTMMLVLLVCSGAATAAPAHPGASLLQTWNKELDKASTGAKDNPIQRVVGLLDEMKAQLQKEMDEDEKLYDELMCWCNMNSSESGSSISDSESKIDLLNATIESLTAKVAELTTKIKETEDEYATNKKTLAEATAVREKQLKTFHGEEMDSIQAIENLKAALVVLGKHESTDSTNWHENFLQRSAVVSRAAVRSHNQKSKKNIWGQGHEGQNERGFDDWMQQNDVSDADLSRATQPESHPATMAAFSSSDEAVVQRALASARSFLQARRGNSYGPNYESQSGEILGIMKQMMEEMKEDLSEMQEKEKTRAATFADLKAAKSDEIASGEKLAEQKEDELATAQNDLAEAKEDLGQTSKALAEFQTFLKNLSEQCKVADKNFQARKKARLDEIKAVSETLDILTADEARDAANGTYGEFIQVAQENGRKQVARLLRRAAAKTGSPELSMLATKVELDAFTKVKEEINKLIENLEQQQKDEVAKDDYCKDKIQENEMNTAKTTDHKSDLEAKIASLEAKIKTLADELEAAVNSINELEVNMQRASQDRQAENLDFQKTIADQRAVQEVLLKALDRLANFYDKAAMLQKSKQTPPVPQMEYAPSKGAGGVMSMIEKLVHEARALEASSVQAETDAQEKYELFVADTNDSVATLQREVATKTKERAQAKKEKTETEGNLMDTVAELEGLNKQNQEIHAECDYVLKNFDTRQSSRAQEIEAMKEAIAMLSGAAR